MTWGWKVPSPLPSSTDTRIADRLIGDGQVERPSPVKSPATMPAGLPARPRQIVTAGCEGAVAVAQQHRDRRCRLAVATARSSWPSPLKSPATDRRLTRVSLWRRLIAGWKVPSPLPSSTETCGACRIGDGQVESRRRR